MNGCSPGAVSRARARRSSGSLTSRAAESIADAGDASVEPEAEDVLVLGPDVGMRPVEIGLLGREQVQVPLAVRRTRVQAEPPKIDCQPLGGGRAVRTAIPAGTRSAPAPASPAGDASASRNQACWFETWFGTTSTIVRIPSSRASAISCLGLLERAERRVDRAVVDDVVARRRRAATDTTG